MATTGIPSHPPQKNSKVFFCCGTWARLRTVGVGCNNYFVPVHTQPYIMEMLGTRPGQFPQTERIAARTIALPFFANLTPEQVSRAQRTLTESLANLS